MVELGGYGKSVIETPAKALESLGYKEELRKYGLTDELVTTSLVHDIKKKPKHRYLELNLGAEILGMKKKQPEESPPSELHLHFHNDKIVQIVKSAEDEMRKVIEEELKNESQN